MTAVLDSTTRYASLARRLEALLAERRQVQAEIAPAMSGDDADRATNVDGHVRLAMLDDRIAAVELALAEAARRPARPADDVVVEGDVIIVDLGDGPETFLLGTVEQTDSGFEVITPGSPLGRALVGARTGSTVEYRAANRTFRATVVGIA
ncbi:MAG TPA: GreA/GreB family elongation factor [Jatrophihabitans sp.]|nr:GreA/GreB family elongation factor [Jatrophihabitans sp.]